MEGREITMKWQHQTMTRLYNGIMKSRIRIAPFGVALFVLLAPRPSVAQSDDWRFDFTIYGLLVGMSGVVHAFPGSGQQASLSMAPSAKT